MEFTNRAIFFFSARRSRRHQCFGSFARRQTPQIIATGLDGFVFGQLDVTRLAADVLGFVDLRSIEGLKTIPRYVY